jgi:hypothetical protein
MTEVEVLQEILIEYQNNHALLMEELIRTNKIILVIYYIVIFGVLFSASNYIKSNSGLIRRKR